MPGIRRRKGEYPMNSIKNNRLKFYAIFIASVVCLISPGTEASEAVYTFERVFPVLEQPWYFYYPYSLVSDKDDFIYISDTRNDRIQKFTRDGQFVTKWGVKGNKEGEFFLPSGLAVDNKLGFIYVSDSGNHRIQKFTRDGQFEAKWGSKGTGIGEFDYPYGIAADRSGFVYVADMNNNRIQKFKADGTFVAQWGGKGTGSGQFDAPQGIASDNSGFIYVSDMNNDRVQKLTSDGVFVSQWGTEGSGDGEFYNPEGIAVDSGGFVYVTDVFNHRIQKFTDQGQFVMKWGVKGNRDGEFDDPDGMTFDSSGFIYVADAGNSRIQKFTSEGIFVSRWGSNSGQGEFNLPYGIGLDQSSFIYVADTGNHRIQKFSSEGEFLIEWGSQGTKPGEFISPYDVVSDKDNFIFVADSGNHRIQKFTSDGQFVTEWGNRGSEAGQFILPYGIAIDKDGFVFVTDAGNDRIQKFTSDGVFVSQWGSRGSGPGQFMYPYRLAADDKGFVYVADTGNKRIQKFDSDGKPVDNDTWEDIVLDSPNSVTLDPDGSVLVAETGRHRIRKFTPDGELISEWGELGTYPGQMNYPCDLVISPDGRAYVADTYNHRIQIFRKISVQINNKALIVAGGGPYPGNHLWAATEMNANFVYRTLRYQGIAKENISYLSSDTGLDLDNNGKADDVDGKPTAENFRNIIRKWKTSAADSLVLYLVDHGSEGSFFMDGETSSSLSSSDLDKWLDELQNRVSAEVIVIYDACKSGSFVSALGSGKQKRMVITSTSDTENAHFLNQGTLSFSNFFWTDIFNGHTVKEAFDSAKQATAYITASQNPVLDSNISDEIYIGSGTAIPGDAPVIESISGGQILSGSSSAQIVAEGVRDNDGIAGVRAVILPPDYMGSLSDSTVLELPFVNLMPAGENRYNGSYEGFNIKGTYRIAVYAKDGKGNTTAPNLTTVSVGKPIRRRAVLIAGNSESESLRLCFEKNISSAYRALIFQGYTDDDIYLMSPFASSEGRDGLPTLKNLRYAIETWAADNTRDLVIGFVGESKNGNLYLDNTEFLTGAKLKRRLDTLHAKMPGMVTVICDADNSGAFLPLLAPNEGAQRILISGTSDRQPAAFLSRGNISFSAFFWKNVLNGETVRDAFQNASQDIKTFSDSSPLLDDTGNGIGNEAEDGMISAGYRLGVGIRLVPSQSVSTDSEIPCEPDDRPDAYEPDDEPEQAAVIVINARLAQCHNFHRAGDADTVLFYGLSGKFYTVETDCRNCKIVTEVFDAGGNLSAGCDTRFWDWKCPQEGFYTLRIRPADTSFFGKDTAYLLKLYQPVGPNSGDLTGIVSDAVSGRPVEGAVIKSNAGQTGVSLPNGRYIIFHEPGIFTVTVESPGYKTAIYENIAIPEGGRKDLDAALVPEVIGISQLLRVIQLYSSGEYHCDAGTGDGYGPGQGDKNCTPHGLDSDPQDWQIGLNELLRLIQMSNISGENAKTGGFAP